MLSIFIIAFFQCPRGVAQNLRGNELLKRTLVREPDWSRVKGGVGEVTSILSATFRAMPKNEEGNIGHSAVRYLLNRYFIKSHGWHINGLEVTAAENATSPLEVLEGRVQGDTLARFDRHLRRHGLTFDETLELVAIFEMVIYNDMLHDLRLVWQLHGFSLTAALGEADADAVLDTFMASVNFDKNISELEPEDLKWLQIQAENYINWPFVKELGHKLRQDMAAKVDPPGQYKLEDVARIIPSVLAHLRQQKTSVCDEITQQLYSIEDRNRGCVHLSKFYAELVYNGTGTFAERPEYMMKNGIIENTTDPADASVIITNYMTVRSNCKRASSLHNMCCVYHNCDDIFENIENKVAGPFASPEQILEAIATSDSSIVSQDMAKRLQEIAQHDGRIRLHGRLFAQWMHHVFPRDCRHPRSSKFPEERWTEASLISTKDAEAYVQQHLKQLGNLPIVQTGKTCMPWTTEEEEYVLPKDKHLAIIRARDYLLDVWEFLLGFAIIKFALILIPLSSGMVLLARAYHLLWGSTSQKSRACARMMVLPGQDRRSD